MVARLERAAAAPGEPTSDEDLNPEGGRRGGRRLRPAAVLVCTILGDGLPAIRLTKRSSALKHHPGQLAFPGGKIDDGDAGPEDAALREAEEEIGLDRSTVRVLGTLAPHATVTGFTVTPVLAMAPPFEPVPERGEVDEVFDVPFAYLTDPARYRIEQRRWRGTMRSYYTIPYGPHYVWGATARMLRGLADRLAQ